MPLFQVAIIKKASKNEDESLIMEPAWMLGDNADSVKIHALAKQLASHPTLDVARWEVLVQPFRP